MKIEKVNCSVVSNIQAGSSFDSYSLSMKAVLSTPRDNPEEVPLFVEYVKQCIKNYKQEDLMDGNLVENFKKLITILKEKKDEEGLTVGELKDILGENEFWNDVENIML